MVWNRNRLVRFSHINHNMEFLKQMEDKMWRCYEDIEPRSYVLIVDNIDFYWWGIYTSTSTIRQWVITVIKLDSGFIVFAVVSTELMLNMSHVLQACKSASWRLKVEEWNAWKRIVLASISTTTVIWLPSVVTAVCRRESERSPERNFLWHCMICILQCFLATAMLVKVSSFRYHYSTMRSCCRSRFSTSISGNRLSASEILKREVENEMLSDGYRWVMYSW